MCLLCVCSVVSHDSVFDFVEPVSRNIISSVESEEESIYDRPRPARGLLACFLIFLL